MKNIVLYGHGSSHNHGCEALVRTITKVIRESYSDANIILYSNIPENDYKWGINEVVDEIRKMPKASFLSRIERKAKSMLKIKNNDINNSIARKFCKELNNVDFAVSIGGDNYCYSNEFNALFFKINELLHKKNIKTVFWGCSIEEKFINDKMIRDLKKYNLITVRETLTQQNLRKRGIEENVKLIPDTAFNLETKKIEYPQLDGKKVVGINISPMIMEYEGTKNITYSNYVNLVKHILTKTDYSIALISHVVDSTGGDLRVNNLIYNEFVQYKDRIFVVPEMKAENVKYIISKCEMFIGARTHATIAAYSNCIPTLVVGYSVKAKGIALDLFGTYENYVIPVQSLQNEDDLIKAFEWLNSKKNEIKKDLNSNMEEYKGNINKMKNILKEKMDNKCTIAVCSCDKYEELWKPFFICMKENWKNIPYPIVLNTESKSFKMEGMNIKTFNMYKKDEKVAWGKRFKETLEKIDTEYVIVLLDDFFLKSPVKQEKIDQTMQWMDANNNIAVFCFDRTHGDNIKSEKYENFELRPQNGEYRFNCQAAIWRRKRLIKFIRKHESPWDWELLGSKRSRRYHDEFYSRIDGSEKVFDYDIGGVLHRGKWMYESLEPLIKKYNLDIRHNNLDALQGSIENNNNTNENIPKRSFMTKVRNRMRIYITKFKSLI